MPIYQTTEYDLENQFDWTSIQYTIEDDIVIATRTTFDAGYEVFGTYENGTLRQEIYVNTLEALGFDNRTIEYDATGTMTYRGTVYPDQIRVSETFQDGVLSQTTMMDGFVGDGVRPWAEIVFSHDQAGNIVGRTTTYDDGTQRSDTFEPGVFETTQDFAQTESWDFIDRSFDANGNLTEQTTTYDNGIVKHEVWDNGSRVSTTRTDTQDVKNWASVTKKFEDGQLSEQRIDRDSGDVTVSLFTDGVRTQRLQYDGDDSASWVLRVTDFAAEGGREVTRYDAIEDIPEDLLGYFPELTPPVELTEYLIDFNDDLRFSDGDQTLDGEFTVSVSKGQHGIDGILTPHEYGGESPDADLEAFNSWGATVGFRRTNGEEFSFESVSLANSSRSDTTNIPESNWANKVTVNGYDDDVLVHSVEIDLTFDHVTHELNWQDIDRVDFVASGGGITNEHVENAGWFSMDDLSFLV